MIALPPTIRAEKGGLLIKLMLALAILAAVAVVAWVILLPTIVVSTIRSRTGFSVKVDKLSVNPFTAKVAIQGLVLKNPATWPAESFVELREFRADVELFTLFSRRLVADEIVVDVAQLTLVKNQDGIMNAVAFRDTLTGRPPTPAAGPKSDAAKKEFLIRHLVLKFDKLTYVDYTGGRTRTKDYNLNISRDMRDVDSVAKIVSPFSGAVLAALAGTMSGLFPNNADVLQSFKGGLQQVGEKTGAKLKELMDSLDKLRR